MEFTRASQVATGVLFHSSMVTPQSWWTLRSSEFWMNYPFNIYISLVVICLFNEGVMSLSCQSADASNASDAQHLDELYTNVIHVMAWGLMGTSSIFLLSQPGQLLVSVAPFFFLWPTFCSPSTSSWQTERTNPWQGRAPHLNHYTYPSPGVSLHFMRTEDIL